MGPALAVVNMCVRSLSAFSFLSSNKQIDSLSLSVILL